MDFREKERGRGERQASLCSTYVCIYYLLLVMCPDQGSNPQPWLIAMDKTNRLS